MSLLEAVKKWIFSPKTPVTRSSIAIFSETAGQTGSRLEALSLRCLALYPGMREESMYLLAARTAPFGINGGMVRVGSTGRTLEASLRLDLMPALGDPVASTYLYAEQIM